MRKYWINTVGKNIVKISLTDKPLNSIVDGTTRLYVGLRECSLFQYFMYDVFRINLLARKELRYSWLKSSIKIKMAHFILAIVSGLSKVSQKTR